MSMTIEEIRTSVTMALCKSVVTKDEELVKTIENDVEDQCTIIGEHLALKFKLICMKDAEECMTNKKKMSELFKKFELVGPRYSTEIKDSEMEFLLKDEEESEHKKQPLHTRTQPLLCAMSIL